MIVSELFNHINDAYRGTDDDAPTSGTDFSYWLRVANRKINEWAKDTKNIWESLWSVEDGDVIVAGTQEYTVPTGLIALSDDIIVTDTSGNDHKYQVIKAKERSRLSGVYVVGTAMTFTDDIVATDPIVGGTIKIPGYWMPTALVDGGTILVDDPYWLVYAMAADLASNEMNYVAKAGNLQAQANELYAKMAESNRRGTNNNPRKTPTNVQKIVGVK